MINRSIYFVYFSALGRLQGEYNTASEYLLNTIRHVSPVACMVRLNHKYKIVLIWLFYIILYCMSKPFPQVLHYLNNIRMLN